MNIAEIFGPRMAVDSAAVVGRQTKWKVVDDPAATSNCFVPEMTPASPSPAVLPVVAPEASQIQSLVLPVVATVSARYALIGVERNAGYDRVHRARGRVVLIALDPAILDAQRVTR